MSATEDRKAELLAKHDEARRDLLVAVDEAERCRVVMHTRAMDYVEYMLAQEQANDKQSPDQFDTTDIPPTAQDDVVSPESATATVSEDAAAESRAELKHSDLCGEFHAGWCDVCAEYSETCVYREPKP